MYYRGEVKDIEGMGEMKKNTTNHSDYDIEKKRLTFLLSMILGGGILIVVYLALTGNVQQVFKDVVNGNTAMDGSNKSAERTLVYAFSILGSIVYFIYFLTTQKLSCKHCPGQRMGNAYDHTPYIVLALSIFISTYYFVYLETNVLLNAAAVLVLVLYAVDKTLVTMGLAFLYSGIYAFCACFRVYAFAGGEKSLSVVICVILSLIMAFAVLPRIKWNKKEAFCRGIMVFQLFIPFLLLIYLTSKYKYEGNCIRVHVPYKIQAIIILLILAFIAEAVSIIRKNWNRCNQGISSIISYGACVSIMAFNRYSGTGLILSTDLHHPYEDIIGYTQVVELGQKVFSEYIPVSGMYSFVQGFFLSFFGHGKAAYHYLTANVFFLTVILLIVFLLKKQLRGEYVLFISFIFTVIDYNRVIFIAPIMLLLAWPQLIEKKNLWLKTWVLTSFLHGLYYPVYGAAVCLGYMPLGIWQIFSYYKSDELKRDMKKLSFWVCWGICCTPIGIGIPLLLGILKHMGAMGGQTIYADGTSRFGQMAADNFFPYVNALSVRQILYYEFSFLILISVVWISVALCLKLGNVRVSNRKISVSSPVPAFIVLSIGIVMLVSVSYTVVRLAEGDIYVRSTGVIFASFVMFMLVLCRYMSDNKTKRCIFAFAVFIIAAVSGEGFLTIESNSKMDSCYTVPENYVYVQNSFVDRLGVCFVDRSIYNLIEYCYNENAELDRNKSYLGIVSNFGLFYFCKLKGDSVIEIGTIKGYDAAKETIDLIQQNDTIVGKNFNSVDQYYLYHWLLTSGKYVWVKEDRRFVPNSQGIPREDVLVINKDADMALGGAALGRTASSWGSSMEGLESIFEDVQAGYTVTNAYPGVQINFDVPVDGNMADFVYFEFAGQDRDYQYILRGGDGDVIADIESNPVAKYLLKKDYNRGTLVTVSWTDDKGSQYSMNCSMGEGRLLIPLGGGRGWLLNEHSNIMINVVSDGQEIAVPIHTIRFLKLQEVE